VILVDTAVWVDHLRSANPIVIRLLNASQVLSHPFVFGELALGNQRQRQLIRVTLADLPRTTVASDDEVLNFIDRFRLFESGIGYVDAHLLAASLLTPETLIWTADRNLHRLSERLGVAARLSQ
jgi:predicted nucleic acid-binding protein